MSLDNNLLSMFSVQGYSNVQVCREIKVSGGLWSQERKFRGSAPNRHLPIAASEPSQASHSDLALEICALKSRWQCCPLLPIHLFRDLKEAFEARSVTRRQLTLRGMVSSRCHVSISAIRFSGPSSILGSSQRGHSSNVQQNACWKQAGKPLPQTRAVLHW